MYGVHNAGLSKDQWPRKDPVPPANRPPAPQPDEQEARALEFMGTLETLFTDAITKKVAKLAKELLAKGLVSEAKDKNGEVVYLPGRPAQRPPGYYARARNAPSGAWRGAEFEIRRGLNRPRPDGAKAFKSGGDARTLVTSVMGPCALVWATSGLFRCVLNAETASTGPDFEAPAGGLEALGIVGGIAAGCSLLDGLDMFNAFLDAVDEQDRWKVEVLCFHRHFTEYFDNRKAGLPSSPEVIQGFLHCKEALSRCALFDKSARQALRRCYAAMMRDSVLSSAGTLTSVASLAMKIQSGANLASMGFGVAGLVLGVVGLPLLATCAGIDIWVGRSEISFRKKEYRRCKAKCIQIQQQIDKLAATSHTDGDGDGDDRKALLDTLRGALKRQRRLEKQARHEMHFGVARVTKGVANAAVCVPLGTAAAVTGVVATAAVAWPVGVAATAAIGVVGTGYLLSYYVKAGLREILRARSRSELYDATILAATTSAQDRTRLLAKMGKLSVAGTQGYWVGGRDGFAGGYVHHLSPETQAVAALDEFSGLVARRSATGHPDAVVEASIKELLATNGIDEALFNDIERMIRKGANELRAQGAHPRDIEWQELMARREQYAVAFGLPPSPAKLQIGALLPSFHAACWIARLSDSDDTEAKKFAKLLDLHLKGDQVDLHAMNEWLDRNGHLAESFPLTSKQMQAAANRLFQSVPPALFMDHTKALLKAIAAETGDRQAFEWQDDSPVLRDLTAFSRFARTRWVPAHQVLSRICAHPIGGVARGVRMCTGGELSAARRHLASGGSAPPPWDSQDDRRALEAVLHKEWARRFAADTPGTRRRTAAVLAEHCAARGKLAGSTWSNDAKGDFYCDRGGCKVAVIRADALAKWVARGDWTRPLPIEMRSRALASAVRWLIAEPGTGVDVDERFLREAGRAPSLLDIHASFDLSEHNRGMHLHSHQISRDGIPFRHGDDAKSTQFTWLNKKIGGTCRVALGEASAPSTRPWALLERTVLDGATRWELQSGDKKLAYPTLDAAVQACCDARRVDAVHAVFLTNPARPRRLLQSGPHSRRAHVQERTPLPHRPMDSTAA